MEYVFQCSVCRTTQAFSSDSSPAELMSGGELIFQGHFASCDPHAHDKIPDDGERPKQRTPDEQSNWPVRQPGPIPAQMNLSGIECGDASSAECCHRNKKLPGRDGECRENACNQDDGNPTFGGKCKCAFHRVTLDWHSSIFL
jgi:hypothetical protein